MKLCEINPFLRYAELQPSVLSSAPLSCSYDYRIFYIVEGRADLVLADQTLPICAGMLIYFRPGTPYYFDGKVKVIVLNFDMTLSKSHIKTPLPPTKTTESFDETLIFENDPPKELEELITIENAFAIETKMQECLLHHGYPTPISEALTSALLKQILCFIAEHSATRPRPNEVVQKTLLYIQQNYDKDITNEQISATFGYHSFYLNRIFKRGTGKTIHQAVIGERIRIAKSLLLETDLSVKAIAAEVGYADHTRFCTAFKACTGTTPLKYRSNAQ